MKTDNLILEKSFKFAVMAVQLASEMKKKREYALSNQFVRSATGIGANVEEALAAHSRKDFLNKMTIASKEARESHYWLRLFQASQVIEGDFSDYLEKAGELKKILSAIVKTTNHSLIKN